MGSCCCSEKYSLGENKTVVANLDSIVAVEVEKILGQMSAELINMMSQFIKMSLRSYLRLPIHDAFDLNRLTVVVLEQRKRTKNVASRVAMLRNFDPLIQTIGLHEKSMLNVISIYYTIPFLVSKKVYSDKSMQNSSFILSISDELYVENIEVGRSPVLILEGHDPSYFSTIEDLLVIDDQLKHQTNSLYYDDWKKNLYPLLDKLKTFDARSIEKIKTLTPLEFRNIFIYKKPATVYEKLICRIHDIPFDE